MRPPNTSLISNNVDSSLIHFFCESEKITDKNQLKKNGEKRVKNLRKGERTLGVSLAKHFRKKIEIFSGRGVKFSVGKFRGLNGKTLRFFVGRRGSGTRKCERLERRTETESEARGDLQRRVESEIPGEGGSPF